MQQTVIQWDVWNIEVRKISKPLAKYEISFFGFLNHYLSKVKAGDPGVHILNIHCSDILK